MPEGVDRRALAGEAEVNRNLRNGRGSAAGD